MKPYLTYDEVHVVSDLHMGGEEGLQIFNLGETFHEFVRKLTKEPANVRLALVINGDMVDFLAEPGAECFDPVGAIEKLDRIARDGRFLPVWDGLREFVATPGRQLVLTLGNHDLELALPWVRERLLDLLSDGHPERRGQILLSFEGSGFLCGVGGKKVLCVHGNEVDAWNFTDYETLRRIGRDVLQGRPVEPWKPNAGSRMVVEVMNEIKRKHPFVDLLKPELEAVVPTLLALDRGLYSKMLRLVGVVGRMALDETRRFGVGYLSADSPSEERTPESAAQAKLDALLRRSFEKAGSSEDAAALLDRAEERLESDQDPQSLVTGDEQEEYLGILGAFWNKLTGAKTEEVLRAALERLQEDHSFDLDNSADETFQRLDKEVGTEIDYLIAGHTHLERDLPRRAGGGRYFNSGTWTRLIRLAPEVLRSAEKFSQVYEVLSRGKLEELDAAGKKEGEIQVVIQKPAVVSIRRQGAAVEAELSRVHRSGDLMPPSENYV